jgi:hypothetical protein
MWRRAEDGRDKRPELPSLPHSGYCGCGCFHYHVHCVVPGGGLSADHKRWIHTSHPLFLLPIPVLRSVFRNRFLDGLRHLYRKERLDCRGPATDFSDPVPTRTRSNLPRTRQRRTACAPRFWLFSGPAWLGSITRKFLTQLEIAPRTPEAHSAGSTRRKE